MKKEIFTIFVVFFIFFTGCTTGAVKRGMLADNT